jgi:hypothetical protein
MNQKLTKVPATSITAPALTAWGKGSASSYSASQVNT